jgi:hypothetical protein
MAMTAAKAKAVEYEICVDGHLDARWLPWFAGLELIHLPAGQTQLRGSRADQAALHGLLARIRDLNLTLITVQRLPLANAANAAGQDSEPLLDLPENERKFR